MVEGVPSLEDGPRIHGKRHLQSGFQERGSDLAI